LLSRFGEGLTGKSSAQHIVIWNCFFINLCNVVVGVNAKVGKVGINGKLIDLRGKYALATQLAHGDMKSADSGKKVDEMELISSQKQHVLTFVARREN
jgi:hypothetical protein